MTTQTGGVRDGSDDDTSTQEIQILEGEEDISPPGRLQGLWTTLSDPRSPALVYAGIVAMALGFAVAAYTWGRVAGLLSVPLQMPYIASGGFTAIGLVAVGAALTSIGASRRDAARHRERLDELVAVLGAIREAVEEE